MPQPRQYPALDDLHRGLDLGLVFRVVGTRRQDAAAVVTGKVQHGVRRPGLVAAGLRNHRARVVRNDQLGHAAVVGQRLDAAFQPVGRGLRRRRPGKGVIRGAQGGHEDVGLAASSQRDGRAGVVDEQLVAGPVHLTHRALQCPGKAPVVLAELGVLVGLDLAVHGPFAAVFLPQKHQRHAFAAQLQMHPAVVGRREDGWPALLIPQLALQLRFVHLGYRGPLQSGRTGQLGVFGDDAFGQAQRLGYLFLGQPAVQAQPQYFFDFTHCDLSGGHPASCHKSASLPARVVSFAQLLSQPTDMFMLIGRVVHGSGISFHNAGIMPSNPSNPVFTLPRITAQARPEYALHQRDIAQVAQIARQQDGMPARLRHACIPMHAMSPAEQT